MKALLGLTILLLRVLFSILILVAIGSILRGIADSRVIKIPQEQYHYLGNFQLSRYYSPVIGQGKYYISRKHDLMMNCGATQENDCVDTTDGHILTGSDAGFVYACPKNIKLGTKIKLVFHWGTVYGICRDRGGAIKGARLDSRCGYGLTGLNNIFTDKGCYTGRAKIYGKGSRKSE